MSCDLIQGNKWSNASLLVKRENSTHYFIMNSCAANPCKNGGTCISLDQEASYRCACIDSNYTTTIHGRNCEILKVAENTSDIYFRFDTATPTNQQKAGTSFQLIGNVKILNVPDKRQTDKVLHLLGISGSYAQISGFGRSCPMDIEDCHSSPNYGLTVLLWFKMLRRSQRSFSSTTSGSCEHVYNILAWNLTPHSSEQGFVLAIRGCKTGSFDVQVLGYSQSWILTWGDGTDESWSKRWSNVAFTFLQSEGLTLYFNGKKVRKQTSYSSRGAYTSYRSDIRMGQGEGSLEVFADDLMIWYKRLTPVDIKFMYERGLQLGYNN